MDDITPNRPDPRLARAVRDRLAPATDACPDAEQIAAWTEGTLDAAAAARLEAHLADCARCQSFLAAFAATDVAAGVAASPAQPAATNVVTFTPRRATKWVLPIAAGVAASLVVWTMTRNVTPTPVSRDALPVQESVQAAAERPADATPSPAPSTTSTQQFRQGVQTQREARSERDTAKGGPGRQGQKGNPPKTEAVTLPAPAPQASAAAPPTAVAPPPPAPPPPPVTVSSGSALVLPGPRNSTVSGALPGARMDAVELAEAKPLAQFSSIDPRPANAPLARSAGTVAQTSAGFGRAGGAGGGRGGAGGRGGSAAKPVAAAPERPSEELNVPTYWRVLPGNRIERSRDSGLTWTTIKIDADLPAVTNGVAPAGSICWLVGANGLVLVSTNALTFTRVTAPAEVDLVSIQAVDGRTATATAADGRTFTTEDGGKTWKPVTTDN